MSEKPDRLDVAQMAERELTGGAFPVQSKQAFRVYIDRKIHERIADHAKEKLSLEICGILVGDWHKDDNGPFVLVNESIRCDKAVSNAGDVTLTHDDWTDVNREMDTKFTDRKIVGWYHSHPNYGIFLSERDRFIQEYTFNSPGQIAYVVDPVNGVEGVFCWRNGKARLFPYFWVGDEVHLSSDGKEPQPSSTSPAQASAAPSVKQEAPPPATFSMTILLAAACMLLLGYLLGGMRTNADRLQAELGAVAHYGLFKGLRPGLREDLDGVQNNVQVIAQAVAQLSKEHIAAAGDAKEEKLKQWTEVLQALLKTALDVQKINKIYGLTPDETAAIQQLINQKEAEAENVALPSSAAAKPSGGPPTAPKPTTGPPKPSSDKPAPPGPTAAH